MGGLRSRRCVTISEFAAHGRRIALALAFSWLAGLAPAQAQFLGLFGSSTTQPPAQLTPQELVQRLSRAGFRVVKLRSNGNVFLADVTDRGGQSMRLVVNATDGAILQRFATASPRMDGPNGGLPSPQPGFAPSYPAEGEASAGARPRAPAARVKPAPSVATMVPTPGASSGPPQATPPVAAAPSAPPALVAPMVGSGFANGVPINPLD
jgi:hypothetical protein